MKRRDLKITWSSNGSWTQSGYGNETRDILNRLTKDDWQLAEIAFFGLQGHPIELNKRKVYPQMGDPYGSDAIVHHSSDFGAQVCFTMQDIPTLNPQALMDLKNRGIKWIPYLPIDQSPPNPQLLSNLNLAYKIVTFSKFGQKELEDSGYTSTLIEEGLDIEMFKPLDKIKCRQELGLPLDAFIFGMIGANKENPPRKGFQEALEAFAKFSQNHPNGAMFFHTQQTAPGNFPILEYAKHLGIQNKVYFLDQYAATFKSGVEDIVKQINTFDVCLHPSLTEGFGLLVIESQACGVPAIVNNCHSMPELIIEGKTGEISKTGKPWWRSLNGYVYPADVDSLHEKMETLYTKLQDEKTRKQIQKDCRSHIIQNYNIDTIVKDRWIPFLEELQEELVPVKLEKEDIKDLIDNVSKKK